MERKESVSATAALVDFILAAARMVKTLEEREREEKNRVYLLDGSADAHVRSLRNGGQISVSGPEYIQS
jgi:hypothetical protein